MTTTPELLGVDWLANGAAEDLASSTLEAAVEFLSSANIHRNPPEHSFERGEGAVKTQVERDRDAARMHRPIALKLEHVGARDFFIIETGGAVSGVAGNLGGGRGRETNEKDIADVGGVKAIISPARADTSGTVDRVAGKK